MSLASATVPPSDTPVSVAARIYRILAAFAPTEHSLPLAEVARRADLPKSTTHRLAGELVDLGLLERVNGRFCLGLRLFELGQMVPAFRLLRDLALPVLEDLQQATGQTVHFAVLDGTDVVYLEILHPPRTEAIPSRVGGRLPAYCTSVGKCLLAYSPESVVQAVIAAGLPRRTPRTICMPGRFQAELAQIRQTGHAYDSEESQVGVVCVGVPVHAADGRAVAAVSVTGRSGRINLERLTPGVTMAGMTLTRLLRQHGYLRG